MQKENNKLSTVAAEFRELDLIFRGGSDLDVVEMGYARKLIQAIDSKNEVLECEAFKSLGDVYLHKAKKNRHKKKNFNKACSLYEELFRFCRNEEMKQVIEHRIKYAEKCTKLVHGQIPKKSGTEISCNVTLSVATALQEVHKKTEMKGFGVDPLIEAYTSSTVNAVVRKNKHLEIESLKSLGDLYLLKGRAGGDNTCITKAAGLYRAALGRCEDSDGRESLKHRIKYAEKVKEKEINLLNCIPCHPTTSTCKKDLQDAGRALETGDLDTAEKHFATALKSVHGKESSMEVELLLKLGDVYLKRGMQSKDGDDFTKAAALCNAALVRSKREDQDGIKQTIQEISKSFVKYVLGLTQTVNIDDVNKHKTMLKEDRHQVEKDMEKIEQQVNPYSLDDDNPNIRCAEMGKAEAIKALFQKILDRRRMFIAGLLHECMEVMGPSPCKYAMIGLGSQATGLVTPYSDLEFAILIENETNNNIRYFRNLTHYLHLKVINLGETILPAMAIKSLNDFQSHDPLDNWYYDTVTPRGFSFDGAMPHACKTPLGRGKTSELIRTPSNMTKLLEDNVMLHLKKGYHLASVMGNVSLIAGEQELIDEYTALWTKRLNESNGKIPLLLANTILKENSQPFKRQVLGASLLNVKKEIYRFSSIAISCWALLEGIQPTTIWETIAKMHNNGVIDKENTHHLMVLVSISAELRLRTYMNNHGQVETMSALSSMPTDTDSEEKLRKVFYISNTKQLMRYYYTAIPFKSFIVSITEGNQPESPSILFDNSSKLKARVYKSLCDYRKSKECIEQALEIDLSEHSESTAHPHVAKLLTDLGGTCLDLGEHRKAVSYVKQSLQIRRSIYGTAHPDIAESVLLLGSAWLAIGDFEKATMHYEQSLQIFWAIYGKQVAHPDIAGLLNNLGSVLSELGDHRKAVKYFEQSLQMRQVIYGENTAHPDIATTLDNLGIVWGELDDHRKGFSYHEQSLQMRRSIYGENTAHPDMAMSLQNLACTLNRVSDYQNAFRYCEQSLRMNKIIYGKHYKHPDIAMLLNNLGYMKQNVGDHRNAVSYCEQSIQMMRSIYGESAVHPVIALSLKTLGNIWSDLGDHRLAADMFEQSICMMRNIYGKNTARDDIAYSLDRLGSIWSKLGDHKKAISYHQQSLQMNRSICGENMADPDIAMSLNKLGIAWSDLGDHQKARRYHEQSLQMRLNIYGETNAHPKIAQSLNNLGNALVATGDVKKGITYLEQALQMNQRIHGKGTDHADIAGALLNLASAWSGIGDHKKAITVNTQSLLMYRRIYGESTDHDVIAMLLTNLGKAWSARGDHRMAVSYYEQSLQMRRNMYGAVHPDLALSLTNLGEAWSDLGDYKKAVSYIEQSLQIRRSIYGAVHPDIAASLSNMGNVWSACGDHRKAVRYHEQSLQMMRSIYGENTAQPDIAAELLNLGNACGDLGDHRTGAYFHEQALQMNLSIYGEDNAHPNIAASLINLGNDWMYLGDHRKAISYCEQSLKMMRSICEENSAHPYIIASLQSLSFSWRKLGDYSKADVYIAEVAKIMKFI
uniref:Uncharacterized protein n=1 Tax=Branchiostoma floridae TaxID=7739 RepID=C3ZEZ2_BRAFL|eukprot:XP_002593287.1 hypothetical protein BRAFLDRAFT_83833 [Branchiostoma floridae]